MNALLTVGVFYTVFAVVVFSVALILCAVVGWETVLRRYRVGERQEVQDWLKKKPINNDGSPQ